MILDVEKLLLMFILLGCDAPLRTSQMLSALDHWVESSLHVCYEDIFSSISLLGLCSVADSVGECSNMIGFF